MRNAVSATVLATSAPYHLLARSLFSPDMLLGSTAGAQGLVTPSQSRTQFSLWAVMMAPLLMGAHITGLSKWDLETYSNTDVIAVNQDKLGIQGRRNCIPDHTSKRARGHVVSREVPRSV